MGIIMSRIRRSWPTGSTCAGLASRRRGCWRWREDGSAATARSTSKAKIPSIGAGAATLATCRVTDVRLPSQFDGHLQPRRHTMVPTNFRSSGAAEFHRRALSEPDVNLSAHPAPSIQSRRMQKLPVREERWAGPDDPGEPLARSSRLVPEALEFAACPFPQVEVNPAQAVIQRRLVEVAVVVDPTP